MPDNARCARRLYSDCCLASLTRAPDRVAASPSGRRRTVFGRTGNRECLMPVTQPEPAAGGAP